MTRSLRLLAAAFCLLPTAYFPLNAAAPPELTLLRQQYDKAHTERVTATYDAGKAALDAKFTTALENAIASAKGSGDLPSVLALQSDQKALAEKEPLPADLETTPESLKNLRTIYREQLAKLSDERATNATALLTPYQERLQQLEGTLTQNDRVEEAKAVMDYRLALKADEPAPASAPATAMVLTTAGGTTPTAPPTLPDSRKGDDRKAAEWVLSVGGVVRLWDNAGEIIVKNVADLPAGKFSIRRIQLDNNSGAIKPFTDADFAVLGGLERLDWIALNKLEITPAAFTTLGTCPVLRQIGMQYNRTGDALWAPLSSVRSLSVLFQNYDGLPVEGLGISDLNPDTLSELDLGNGPISDAALPEIATFVNLTILRLEVSKVTDAGMSALAPLKKLQTLSLRNTEVTSAGLAALEGIPITQLGYGRSMPEVTNQIPAIAALFPALKTLILPREVAPNPVDWTEIAKAVPKLKQFHLNSHKFGDASCVGLDAFAELERLELIYCPVTDIGIAALATHKSLSKLFIPNAKISDTSLDVLVGMRGLKELKLPPPGNGLTADRIAKFKRERPDVLMR